MLNETLVAGVYYGVVAGEIRNYLTDKGGLFFYPLVIDLFSQLFWPLAHKFPYPAIRRVLKALYGFKIKARLSLDFKDIKARLKNKCPIFNKPLFHIESLQF